MLHVHFSNRFELLAEALAQRLAQAPAGADPFAADEVVVPSAAVTRRLILELARRHGICANVRFSYLAQWLWRQGAALMPTLPAESPFDADVLAWRILAAFEDEAWAGAQPRLADWLAGADAAMRHELARRVAALFDQYLTYRPEWLQAWVEGRVVDVGTTAREAALDQRWQAALWRRLALETGSAGEHPFLGLLHELRSRGIGLAGTGALPAKVHVVALPAVPPVHLALLQHLGAHVDVHLYVLNPCREFWFDVADRRRLATLAARGDAAPGEEGHRLLAAWGRQAQSQLALLVDAADTALVDDAHYLSNAEAGRAPTLLAQLQDSILALRPLAPGALALADGDRSVEVHACHSLTRQLEVLHDRLLGLFAQPDAPQPSDVLVAVPDLDAAAPLIDAVFGTAPPARHVPYAITGRARARVNAPARALLDALALAGSRLPVSAVLGLLQQPVVARRFGLGAGELDQVRDWLAAAGVHWALDADHRASLALPAHARHSLSDGLARLFLGYAMPERAGDPVDGRLPAGDAEGSAALALGAFQRFVDALAALRAQALAPRPPEDWIALLAGALADFVAAEGPELDDLREVHDAIDQLATRWRRSALALPLALEVVRAALEEALDEPGRGGVPTGLVTFASIASLRNVPYRVVCAIGLDDGAFPGAARPPEFDLMAHRPRAGDRQRRLDDRNVFLDLLLAARDVLHLSYTGRSVRDNAALPPSVLVAELLDAVQDAAVPPGAGARERARVRRRLVVEHPLQPFSERAFAVDADPRVRSFRAEYADALRAGLAARAVPPAASSAPAPADEEDEDAPAALAAPFIARPLPAPDAEWRALPIERLAAFLRAPCRALLVDRLGLALRRDEEPLSDDEPFVPALHAGSPLVQRLLPALLDGLSLDEARAIARASPQVPAGGFGERVLERELAGLHAFAARVRAASAAPLLPPHAVSLALEVDGQAWHLHGGFADLRETGLVRHRWSRRGPRDLLDAWLPHLLACAVPPAGCAAPRTLGLSRDGPWLLRPAADAAGVLRTLVGLYARGLREPLPFFPRTSWAYVDGNDSLAKAEAEFRPNKERRSPAESEDDAVQLALRGRPGPLAPACIDEFAAIAHAVYDPLRAHLERAP
jgi:exodeoxyribonuclease V gamma subunit